MILYHIANTNHCLVQELALPTENLSNIHSVKQSSHPLMLHGKKDVDMTILHLFARFFPPMFHFTTFNEMLPFTTTI